MTQYNRRNVKLWNSQLNKLKCAIRNQIEVALRLSPSIRKAFSNNSSADIEFSKTQLSKMIQSGEFLGKLLGPLLKTGLPLISNVTKPLAKSVLIPLGLTAASSASDAGIHKKILGSENTTLIVSNNDMEHLIKIVKSLEDSGLFLKGVTKSVQNEVKEQKRGFLSALLDTLGASLLGNLLTGKGINRAGEGIVNVYRNSLPNKIKDGHM